MKFRNLVSLLIALGLLLSGQVVIAQEETDDPSAPVPVDELATSDPALPVEEALTYDDYSVKGYTITVFGSIDLRRLLGQGLYHHGFRWPIFRSQVSGKHGPE
jgi:hypothetical protein